MYDIYKGTKEDIEDGNGELMLENCTEAEIEEFCVRGDISFDDLLDGDYISAGEYGYWIEQAM
jgi:hypothetical protein